jgi:hypothetical protein
MNPFDTSIISFVNSFARHSVFFDTLVTMISGDDLVKGGHGGGANLGNMVSPQRAATR